ncbi:hypothetical protein [Caulobacter sp. NIBR2454]|uniref:hypothetical protein n=1 Tax=Caulobacter sp. NIBR2454 TaxID=3015996 RepID=UPI0022B737AB|nr:hypothetical protein [Caulobacter sp. NIBR2454]
MTDAPVEAPRSDVDRNLALVTYALLFSAIFFAGIPALIAVVIAYAQRGHVRAEIGTHHNFQIRIFWIALALSIASAACGLGAVIAGIGDIIEFGVRGDWSAWDVIDVDFHDVRFEAPVIVLTVAALIFALLSTLWLLCAPAFGFIRLASQRSIGNTAA